MSVVKVDTTKFIVEAESPNVYKVTAETPAPIQVTVQGLVPAPSVGGFFTKTLLAGLTQLTPSAEHGLTQVRGARVLRPITRAEIDVYIEFRLNDDVYIEANIDLLNHILIIY